MILRIRVIVDSRAGEGWKELQLGLVQVSNLNELPINQGMLLLSRDGPSLPSIFMEPS